jgi:hypothetical protein
MRKVIIFIFFLITIFIVNILFYYLSSDYRIFLKKIKNNNSDIELQEKSFNDEIIIDDKINKQEEIELIENEV